MTLKRYPHFGVLLVDDEASFIRSLSILLERKVGINHLYSCYDGREVKALLQKENIGLVLLDLTMPHVSGKQLLEMINEEFPDVGVIIISGMNQLETALECMRLGAYDYFVKTTEEARLIEGIRRAIRMQEIKHENSQLRQYVLNDKLEHPDVFRNIITNDKNMRSIFQYLESISLSSQPVLITGESGVGKELIAQAVHQLNSTDGDMVSVNVAGLDDEHFSDTLFGHHQGAFTGALKKRGGMVQQANGGTLFLDEIGDLSLASQVKLLRLLQEGEYYPLGSDRPERMNARVVVATHANLHEKLNTGVFRKDLFYRLKTHHIHLPPLRERKKDIPLLLNSFIEEAAEEMGKNKPAIPKELVTLLNNYSFPGNIRELKALIYDAIARHKSRTLSMDVFRYAMEQEAAGGAYLSENQPKQEYLFDPELPLPSLQEMAELLISEAMMRSDGNQSIAARLIGISQPALSKRLKKTYES